MKNIINLATANRRLVAAALALIVALSAAPVMAAEGKVNINAADSETLQLLPRVGPSLAQRIVEYREENGKFEQATDLMQVRGIGEKTFALMEDYVATSGESTLSEKVRVSRTSDDQQEPEGGRSLR